MTKERKRYSSAFKVNAVLAVLKGDKLYPHKYPPLISESLFNQVQKIKHGANKSSARHAGKKDILLRGLMTCNCCGCRITGDIKKS